MNKPDNFLPGWSIFLIDVFFCFCSLTLAYLLRFNFAIPPSESETFIYVFPFVIISRCLFFYITGINKIIISDTDTSGKARIAIIQLVVTIFFVASNIIVYLSPLKRDVMPYSIITIEYFLSTFIFIAVKASDERFYKFCLIVESGVIKGAGILKKTDKKSDLFLILILIATVAPLIFMSFYNQPSADDFLLQDPHGFFFTQKQDFLYMTGRYFATAMNSLSPMVFHSYIGYKLQTDLLITLFVLAVYWFISLVFTEVNRLSKWGIISLIVFVYFLYFPDIAQGLFWGTGSVNYQLPIIFTILFLGCIIKFLQSGKKIFFIYSILLSFAIVGSNEVSLAFTNFLILLLIIGNYISNRKINYYTLLLLGITIALSVFSIMAPGNRARGTFFPGQHQFLYSVKNAYTYGKPVLSKWTLENTYIYLLILFSFLAKTGSVKLRKPLISPFIILLSCIFIPSFAIFIGFWSTGIPPPPRTMNVPYFYFLLGSVYLLYSLMWYIKQHLNFNSNKMPTGVCSTLIIVVAYLAINQPNNLNVAYDDLVSGRAAYFDKQLNQRYEVIKNCKQRLCKVEPIKDVPKSFCLEDIIADSNYWRNQMFARYYGKMCVLTH